jgi:hypothetical protein
MVEMRLARQPPSDSLNGNNWQILLQKSRLLGLSAIFEAKITDP